MKHQSKTMLDDARRFEIREMLVKEAGVDIAGYESDGILVAVARGRFVDLWDVVRKLGGVIDDPLHYFPLGSDKPPDALRHWCEPWTKERGFDTPGFWLYAKVKLP